MSSPEPVDDPLIAVARAWYDAGYCVIPAHEDGGKRPFGRWKDYQTQRPDWDDVIDWLSSGRYTGIGVLTGAASGNVEMIELEGPMDDAVERLGRVFASAAQFSEIGVPQLLADISRGCVEQSAGGGLHLFIQVSDGPAHGNTKLARTVDGKVISETRGEGGFVVVAPTTARNGHAPGAAYLFINGGHPSRTVSVTGEERDILHTLFTLALDEHVDEPAPPAPAPATPSVPSDGPSAFDDYRARVTWRDILEPAGWAWSHRDGERDYWVRPGKSAHDGHSASTIEDGPLFNFSGNANLPVEEALTKGQVYAHLHHDGDLSRAARALVDDGYGIPPTSRELPAWEAGIDPDATIEEREEAAGTWVRERLPLLDWHHLWQDDTEEEWLVEPILARRRLVALYSAPKVGKSLLMLELAAALACGRPVLGNAATAPIRTLYVDFENDPRGDVRERLRDMDYAPTDLENLCYLSYPTLAKLDTRTGSQELMAAITEYGCEVVVIDTVSRSVQGDENENDTWLNFYRHTGLKLKQAGVALIRLDHSGKDESKGQRGGSAKSGDVDAVWRMQKMGETLFRLVCEAQRFQVTEQIVDLERVESPRLHHKRVMDTRGKVLEEILPKYAEAGIPRDPALSVRKVRALLREAKVTFVNQQVTAATFGEYVRRMPTFTALAMVEEGS